MPSLIDIGLNLTDKSFDKDRDEVIERAKEVGVSAMILTGSTVECSKLACTLAKTRPGLLFSTAGVHPHHAAECDDATIPALRDVATLPEVVAVGECGLDFFRNISPPEAQEKWMDAQLQLAVDLQMPVFLHERDAHESFAAILRNHIQRLPDAVVHCFTGARAALDDYLTMGCHIGVTGWICDERRGKDLQELVKHIPIDRLLVETDAPYLLPRDLKPKPKERRNEPCHLPHVTRRIAECIGQDFEAVAAATTENARRFFRLP
ncbi:MAG: TatD DNase family protein [Candidatus Binatia bacterium]|jgi:TatD DNase family protein